MLKKILSLQNIFFVTLIALSFILIPYSDSYYYWDWGRHLAFGYYDGPPMVAYFMRIFTAIFGNHIFSINFLGVSTIFITAHYIYRTGKILFDQIIARNATLLWLLSTPVFHYLFLWITYDNLLCLFWAATIYHVVRYIGYQKIIDLYAISIFSACMLLSKYTGVILLLAIFIFCIVTQFRHLFREKHFYFSMILFMAILSPHLYWHYQHHWISFLYLFSHHTQSHSSHIFYFFIKIIKTYDVLLILPMYGWITECRGPAHIFFVVSRLLRGIPRSFLDPSRKLRDDESKGIAKNKEIMGRELSTNILFLHMINIFFLAFLFFLSFKNSISKHWLTPFTLSSALLTSFYFEKFHLKKLFFMTILLYTIWGVYYLTVNSLFQRYFDEDFFKYRLIQKFSKKYPDEAIVTADWETAAKLSFWVGEKRIISTLPCGNENQYAEWSQHLNRFSMLYLDFKDRGFCIKKFFAHCEKLNVFKKSVHSIGYIEKAPEITLFIYRCGNSHNPPPIKI